MQSYLKSLKHDKIKINWNKSPIKMDLFLSFLLIDTSRNKDCLGSYNGWTEHIGIDNLKIGGGIVNNVEYLNCIQYKKKLDNSYNNYVNPFYIFDILNDEGKDFFIQYYSEEIKELIIKAKKNELIAKQNFEDAKKSSANCEAFWSQYINIK